jgi:hypothetical protein
VHFVTGRGTISLSPRDVGGRVIGEISAVVDKQYLTRQATTLLKFAQSISDPRVSAGLVEKAADLKDQLDGSTTRDTGPWPPDVQTRTAN